MLEKPKSPAPIGGWPLAVALIAFGSTTAQQFARQPAAQDNSGAVAPTPIDLDGDGDLDFVALIGSGGRLQHWRNTGGSRCVPFAAPTTDLLSLPTDRTATGDFDGDGDIDLLLGLTRTGRVQMLRNVAGQLLGPPVELPALRTGGALDCTAMDADRDGDLDVLARTVFGLDVLLNDGTGNFALAPAALLPPTTNPTAVEVTDIDRDGAIDILVLDFNRLAVWLARPGGFVDESSLRLPPGTTRPSLVAVADADGDADPDLITMTNWAPTTAALLRNDGTGRFTLAGGAIPPPAAGAGPLLAADLDADADIDLLVGRRVLDNDGTGTFAPGMLIAVDAIATLDLDGDRWVDLLTTSSVARNEGGRGFRRLERCWATVADDLDGDGDRDLLDANGSAWITEGDVRRRQTGMPIIESLATFLDLDRDGDNDIADHNGDQVRILANGGAGNFALAFSFASVETMGGPIVGFDLEGDGDMDLACGVASFVPTRPLVLRNDGNLTFTSVGATVIPNPIETFTVTAADLDGDGFDDLVAAGSRSATLLRNRGNGTFAEDTTRPPTGFGGGRILAIQIDRDPEPELLATTNPGLRLIDRVAGAWVDATWRLPGTVGLATHAVALDFDRDGDLDLAIAGGSGLLLQNDGSGVFADVTSIRGPFTATVITAFDADGDGDPDLLDGRDLWLNQQRQLELAAPVGVGGRLALEFVAEPGFGTGIAVCITTLGLLRSPAGRPLFGGNLIPEPLTSISLGAIASVGGQRGATSLAVPNLPQLRGLTLQIQGLVIGTRGELALANHLVATIE